MTTLIREHLAIYHDHQRRAIAALDATIGSLENGMSAEDIVELARGKAADQGFDRWFHEPEVDLRCTAGRRWPTLGKPKLERGQLVTIDIAPATAVAYGDVGTTLRFGGGDPELLKHAREVCRATLGYASRLKTVGELQIYAKAWANNRQLRLGTDGAVGHACLPHEGLLAISFPKSALRATWLRRNQIRMLNPQRLRGMWALRVPISDGEHVAVVEEVLYVDDEQKVLLGRPGLEHIGVYPSLGLEPEPLPGLKGEKQQVRPAAKPAPEPEGREERGHDHDHDHGHDHDHAH